MSGQLVNLLRAVAVLQRRRMINLANPAELVTAAKALRHYGSFGGLVTYTAARHGDSPALTDERGTLTFRELDQLSNAVARVLVDLRLGGGSTIGLLNRSHRGVMVGLAAAGKAGVRTVLLNTGFAGPQLRDVCVRERVSLVLADQEFSDVFAALPDDVDVLLNWAEEAPTRPTLDDLASSRSADPMPYPPPSRRPGVVDQRDHRHSQGRPARPDQPGAVRSTS